MHSRREPVRHLTLDVVRRHGSSYVVHLEDNEMAVSGLIVSVYDPLAMEEFLQHAAGMTAVVDRLLELKPDHVPGVVIWPGYDGAIDRPGRPREVIRNDIGLEEFDIALVYTGSVHEVNADEVSALYAAVEHLRAVGRNVVLVKSGFNSIPASRLPKLGRGIRDLGWIRRRRIFELLRAADILVSREHQGRSTTGSRPSCPSFSRQDGQSCCRVRTSACIFRMASVLLLERGDADEIHRHVELLVLIRACRNARDETGLRPAQAAVVKSVDRLIAFYGLVRDGTGSRRDIGRGDDAAYRNARPTDLDEATDREAACEPGPCRCHAYMQ
jgi:hypothetical protein